MTHGSFTVLPYDPKRLYEALINDQRSKESIGDNKRIEYICGHIEKLDVQSMIIEADYVDLEFLEDYAAFYSHCHRGYGNKCIRVHFFATPNKGKLVHSEEGFRELLHGDKSTVSKYVDAYLGFLVARPLPQAFVGRTVIRPWDDDGGRRSFCALRPFDAHMFGSTFTIPKSLPFQE